PRAPASPTPTSAATGTGPVPRHHAGRLPLLHAVLLRRGTGPGLPRRRAAGRFRTAPGARPRVRRRLRGDPLRRRRAGRDRRLHRRGRGGLGPAPAHLLLLRMAPSLRAPGHRPPPRLALP